MNKNKSRYPRLIQKIDNLSNFELTEFEHKRQSDFEHKKYLELDDAKGIYKLVNSVNLLENKTVHKEQKIKDFK